MRTAFDYMYRDAGNFKAFGSVTLAGAVAEADVKAFRNLLSSGEFFIAEQVGVPSLYAELYEWSGGSTNSDHCWHEFVGFRALNACPEDEPAIPVSDFVAIFNSVEDWDESHSPHFWLADATWT